MKAPELAAPLSASRLRRLTRPNALLSVAILTIVALAPVPAASNRPVFWALAALVVGLVGIGYSAMLLGRSAAPRLALRQFPLQVGIAVVIVAFLLMQALPLTWMLDAIGAHFLLGGLESPAISIASGATLLVLLQFATYAVFYWLVLQATSNRDRALWVINAVLYVVTAHAAYALLALTQLGDPMLLFPKWAYQGNATGTFVNGNSFATFLAMGIVVGLALLLRKGEMQLNNYRRGSPFGTGGHLSALIIIFVCLLILAATLVATQSRLGTFAAATGSVAVFVAYLSRHRGRGAATLMAVGIVAVLVALGALALFGGALLERLGSLEAAADVRGQLYAQILEMIGTRPFVGFGAGAFEAAYPAFHRLPVSADVNWDKAHSTYLALWSELGLVVGSLAMLLIGWMGFRLLGVARRRDRDWASALAGFGVIIVAATHSVADFSLEIEANVLLFLAIVGIGMAGAIGSKKGGGRT
ncbi:MAG: O-antigen ligase family protein [Cucumibacter sp.]